MTALDHMSSTSGSSLQNGWHPHKNLTHTTAGLFNRKPAHDSAQRSQLAIGFAVCGEPGLRLSDRLAMPVSGDTLLRMIRAAGFEPPEAPVGWHRRLGPAQRTALRNEHVRSGAHRVSDPLARGIHSAGHEHIRESYIVLLFATRRK